MHWAVVVIYMTEQRIQFYDSMSGSGVRYLEGLMQYLKDEHKAKKGCPLPDADEWVLVESTPDTPQQRNGHDCGVFTCMFCDFLSMGYPLTFSQEHVTRCRELIALSIMNGVRSPSDPSPPSSPLPSRSSRCVPELARTLHGEAGGAMPLTDFVVTSISAVEGFIGSGDLAAAVAAPALELDKFTSIVDTLYENRRKIIQLDETASAEYEKEVCRDHDLAYAQYLETCELVRHKPCLFPPFVHESFGRLIRIEEMIMWNREEKLKQYQEQILQLQHDLEVAKEEKQAAEKDADRRLKAELKIQLIDQKRDLENSFNAERDDIESRHRAELGRAAQDHHESTKEMLEDYNREIAYHQERCKDAVKNERAIAKDQKETSDAYITELEKNQMEHLRQIRQLQQEKKRMPLSLVRIVWLPSM